MSGSGLGWTSDTVTPSPSPGTPASTRGDRGSVDDPFGGEAVGEEDHVERPVLVGPFQGLIESEVDVRRASRGEASHPVGALGGFGGGARVVALGGGAGGEGDDIEAVVGVEGGAHAAGGGLS